MMAGKGDKTRQKTKEQIRKYKESYSRIFGKSKNKDVVKSGK